MAVSTGTGRTDDGGAAARGRAGGLAVGMADSRGMVRIRLMPPLYSSGCSGSWRPGSTRVRGREPAGRTVLQVVVLVVLVIE